MSFPLEKYTFYLSKNKEGGMTVVAVSTFAGKKVRGIAKCSPEDEFNLQTGKQLAAARCNLKIANKRLKKAHKEYLDSIKKVHEDKRNMVKISKYFFDASDRFDEAVEALDNVKNSLLTF